MDRQAKPRDDEMEGDEVAQGGDLPPLLNAHCGLRPCEAMRNVSVGNPAKVRQHGHLSQKTIS